MTDRKNAMPPHLLFDMLAMVTSFSLTVLVYHYRLKSDTPLAVEKHGLSYIFALVGGAALGGYIFGTLNLVLSDIYQIGRSIVGALAGAIIAIEIYKKLKGERGSTGLVFVPAFAASVTVGRLGCFFAGLKDQTYGSKTTAPWGYDFGDGIMRHPVQLYESFTMGLFLLIALWMVYRRNPFFMKNGFYLMVFIYAFQRFLWEFLKPYGTVIDPFNLFHFVCAALIVYALYMMKRKQS